MPSLFETEGDNLHVIYRNLRDGETAREREIAGILNTMYERFEPYADNEFAVAFANDPEARFWEMFLGCTLLDAGKTLVPTTERPNNAGPDFCVLDEFSQVL